ncbi:MAG: hypothetical protein PF961_03175 [Planctomycetota bacterium]|jgi:hypothetical protein|nr:hypothetical protein [Planctomycetota bacterium]
MGLNRALTCLVLCLGLNAAESHQFVAKQISVYWYDLKQNVTWRSGGDDLTYHTHLRWQFALIPLEVGPETAQVEARILQVKAEHAGPGSTHSVNSRGPDGHAVGSDDPLLGDMLALVDAPLVLTVDPRSGVVSAVSGGDTIINRLERLHPGPPGEQSPMAAAARRSYSSERLARLWSRILLVPSEGEQSITLDEPLGGTAIRTWVGDRYELKLPPEAADNPPTAVLAAAPNGIELQLTELTGSGSVLMRDGILRHAGGKAMARFNGTAMTQDLVQQHQITWELGRIELAEQTTGESETDPSADPDSDTGDEGRTGQP